MEATTEVQQEAIHAEQEKQWFDPENVIHVAMKTVAGIESQEEAHSLVGNLRDNNAYNSFMLGGVLAEIQKRSWVDHGEFYNHIEEQHGIKKRMAQYYMQVWNTIIVLDIPWALAEPVGWSNLKQLSPHLTADNFADWLTKAKNKSYAEVSSMIEAWKADGTIPTKGFGGEASSPTKTLTFKIHQDQAPLIEDAITKAKSEGNTEFSGVALEYMSMDFLAGGKKTTPSLSEMFKKVKESADTDKMAVDVIMAAFCEVFDNAQVEVDLVEPTDINAGDPA
jgi:hypothetical protein